MTNDWPFADPENCATFTTPQVMRQGMPVLLVTHDEEDGFWQFLHGEVTEEDQPMIVALAVVVNQDPTLKELADLPIGWQATRTHKAAPWHRTPKPPDDQP